MCIGDMRFCLENTGKIQIEYIDVFPHIFEVEASQCGGHSKRPLTRHSQRPCLNTNLHVPFKYAGKWFPQALVFRFLAIRQICHRLCEGIQSLCPPPNKKIYIRGPRLRMTFWNSPGSKKS